jgi:ABC-type multidrug transport system fused ATPase/permease subunit
MIQQVVRSEFKEATCFTIAHRINTIMDSDLILVIHEGCVEEFGTPSALMEKKGRFSSLVRAGEEEVDTTTSVYEQTSF